MWIPRNAEEVERAAESGGLEETSSFDGKADLPRPGKNASLAVDVAAMSTAGGSLLYGISEDENERLTVLSPLTLAGAGDRISQIVATSIAEVPYIEVKEHPLSADPAKGFISVLVPQSARAPHQVIVGNDRRFYGRAAKGNRLLTEGEIASLYQRRNEWEQDREVLLAQAVDQAPFMPVAERAYLHGFVRPVAPDRQIWERATAAAGSARALQERLAEAAQTAGATPRHFDPNLRGQVHWFPRGADELLASSSYRNDDVEDSRYLVNVRVNIDGRGHLFCGRAADTANSGNFKLVFEEGIAGNFASFLGMFGQLFELGQYYGHVDLGLAVTGLRGALSVTFAQHPFGLEDRTAYNADVYPRTDRFAAQELLRPQVVADSLLRQLFTHTTEKPEYEVFATP